MPKFGAMCQIAMNYVTRVWRQTTQRPHENRQRTKHYLLNITQRTKFILSIIKQNKLGLIFDISGHEIYQSKTRIINSKNVRSSVLNILLTHQTHRDLIKYDISRPCCYDDVVIIVYYASDCHRFSKCLINLINKDYYMDVN